MPAPTPAVVIPHLALLLPLASSALARHAEAVSNGFLAAARTQGGAPLPVHVYATGDDAQSVIGEYRRALAAGARVVVGPLTRGTVTAIAASAMVMVPTLALNVPDPQVGTPPGFYTLSLQVEAEARQVAQLAFNEGRRSALTLSGDTPHLKRINQAFIEEFMRLGGAHVGDHLYTPDPGGLTRIKLAAEASDADMAFIALDLGRARRARAYLGTLPLYATSQVHPGDATPLVGFDLAGVRFLDMPWMLQPDHPAVMVYPRADYRDDIELDRLYALGIDAYRIAVVLLTGVPDAALDGVTGRLTLGRDLQFTRALTAAHFNDGRLTVLRERP
jgi:outer membrane PBP1 activator LpoA protein